MHTSSAQSHPVRAQLHSYWRMGTEGKQIFGISSHPQGRISHFEMPKMGTFQSDKTFLQKNCWQFLETNRGEASPCYRSCWVGSSHPKPPILGWVASNSPLRGHSHRHSPQDPGDAAPALTSQVGDPQALSVSPSPSGRPVGRVAIISFQITKKGPTLWSPHWGGNAATQQREENSTPGSDEGQCWSNN